MAGSSDLYDAMEEFFNVCYAALADTPGGQPECAYISSGVPAWDSCPCLVVHCGGPFLGATYPTGPGLAAEHRIALVGEVNLVSFTATILRCAAIIGEDGALPTPAEQAAVARLTSADLWAIFCHVKEAKRTEQLWSPKTREFDFLPAVSLNQEGGCTGWQITFQTEVSGYRPA